VGAVPRKLFADIQGEHKVFPDYKHLLQENYVKYKCIFFSQNVTQIKKFFTTH
jgi:hypothetical protein